MYVPSGLKKPLAFPIEKKISQNYNQKYEQNASF